MNKSFPIYEQAAADKVQRGEAKASDFKFVLGHAGWGPGQLEGEINNQVYVFLFWYVHNYMYIKYIYMYKTNNVNSRVKLIITFGLCFWYVQNNT